MEKNVYRQRSGSGYSPTAAFWTPNSSFSDRSAVIHGGLQRAQSGLAYSALRVQKHSHETSCAPRQYQYQYECICINSGFPEG
jgi:hypothetical protein